VLSAGDTTVSTTGRDHPIHGARSPVGRQTLTKSWKYKVTDVLGVGLDG
jgi:hypothetical protein